MKLWIYGLIMLVDKKKRDDDDDGLLLVNNGLSKESGEVVPIIINGLVDIEVY